MQFEKVIRILPTEKKTGTQYPQRPSKRAKFLKRRGSQRINFWDLGMVSTGAGTTDWTMLDFQPSICPFGTISGDFDTTYTQELLDKIFEVPVTSWSTHYKKIVPGMDYKLDVASNSVLDNSQIGPVEILDSSNADFTNSGLKAPSEWFTAASEYVINVGLSSDVYPAIRITRFSSRSATGNKVTTEYDITAPSVTFTPSKKMDIFLVPALPYVKCRLEFRLSGVENFQRMDEFFWLYDRSIFLTPSHALYNRNGIHFVSGLGGVNNRLTELGNSTLYADFVSGYEWIRDNIANCRAEYATGSAPPFTVFDDGTAFGNPTYAYNPPSGDTIWFAQADLSGNSSSDSLPGSDDHRTLLRCVIKQNGTYYYFWNSVYA